MGEVSQRVQNTFPGEMGNPSVRFAINEMELIRKSAFSVALVKARRFRNGIIEYTDTGTGWLIAPGLLMTCWHVIAALISPDEALPSDEDMQLQLKDMLVSFNQVENIGGVEYTIAKLEYPLTNNPRYDFAILRLKDREQTSYSQFGYLLIEFDPALTTQTQLFIIQHPGGEPQQMTIGETLAYSDPERICYTTDTNPGVSGAPVLRRQSRGVVAIHNGKRREGEDILPEGTRMDVIIETLKLEVPMLYREIMHEQAKINSSLIRELSPNEQILATMSLSSQKHLNSSFSPVNLPVQNETIRVQSLPYQKQDSLIQHYTYVMTHTSPTPILCLAFDPAGKSLFYGTTTDGIHHIDTTTFHQAALWKTYTKAVTSLAFDTHGNYLASGGDDGTVTLWDFTQQKRYKTFQAHTDWVTCLAFPINGRHLLSGSDDGSIKIFDTKTRVSRRIQSNTGICAITCHPRQELIASCSIGQTPVLWHMNSQERVQDFPEFSHTFTCLCFNSNGHYLVGGTAEGLLIIYNTQTQIATSLPTPLTKSLRCLAFHPNGSLLACGVDDQTIHLWDVSTGEHIQQLPGHNNHITALGFSPDGNLLASAGLDGKLTLWKSL